MRSEYLFWDALPTVLWPICIGGESSEIFCLDSFWLFDDFVFEITESDEKWVAHNN